MKPDWWFNRGCLFDLGGWILDFQDQRTPQEYLEDIASGFNSNRKKETGRTEDDCDSVEEDLGGTDNTESALIFENGIGKRYEIR